MKRGVGAGNKKARGVHLQHSHGLEGYVEKGGRKKGRRQGPAIAGP